MDPFTRDMRELAAELAAAAAAAKAAAGNGAAGAAGNGNGAGGRGPLPVAPGHGSNADKAAPSVDVTRHNFEAMLPVVRSYLAACDFFAFDCEMTGLFLEGQTENYLDDMQDRYSRYAAAAHSFVITQFGVSCFKRVPGQADGGGREYTAATFNFYLFQRPPQGGAAASAPSRRFTCDAGSLDFLANQGFDFNRWLYDGVSVMPVRQRDELMRQLTRGNGGENGGGGFGPDVVLSKPEDIAFVEGLLTSVREWLAGGAEAPLELPSVNRYLRLLAYQALARPESFGGPPGGAAGWHPGFAVQKTTDSRGWTALRLVRCDSPERAAQLAAEERAAAEADIAAAAGFAAVWEAMRACGRPGVGHNCMFDVAYGVAQFGDGRLPATWEGFKRSAAHWLPGGLYDTKHLCRQLGEVVGGETSLGTMFKALVPQPEGTEVALGVPTHPSLPARVAIAHAPGFAKYVAVGAGKAAHEAGYDAFMTGSVFAALEALMAERQQQAQAAQAGSPAAGDAAAADAPADPPAPYASVTPYAWRLNVTRSDLPYATLRPAVPGDPASYDPVPERPLVYWLGSLAPGVRAGEIHRGCEEAGLGKVRITFQPGNHCLLELASPEAAALAGAGALAATGLSAEVLTYAEFRARKDAMLAAGTWPLPGYGGYGGGGGFGGGGRGAGGAPRPPKRQRTEEQAAPATPAATAPPAPEAAGAGPDGGAWPVRAARRVLRAVRGVLRGPWA